MASDAVVGSSAVEGEPTLIILCGLPGSGKSTLARRLANERPGVRFCPDDWMEALGVDLWDEAFRCRIEQLQRRLAFDVLRCGTTAVIEWGTWAADERESLRREAVELGAKTELIVLDPPLETLYQRVAQRRVEEGAREDPPLTREHLRAYNELFQRPDAAESAAYDMFLRVEE